VEGAALEDSLLTGDPAPAVDGGASGAAETTLAADDPVPPAEGDVIDANLPGALAARPGAQTVESVEVSVTPDPPAAAAPAEVRPLVERVQTYYVAPGDTLYQVAQRFGIDVETLRATNPLPDPDRLLVGQPLTVLPVRGLLQTAGPGDTVAALARRYGVRAADIAAANGLAESAVLAPGQRVLIPGGRPLAVTSARGAAWPTPGTGLQRKGQFIAAGAAPAQESQRQTGVPASVTLAQAILESNWGDSLLAREANNLFGIKGYGAGAGQAVYWMPAWEVVDGEDVESLEPFRAYSSPEASFADHGMFFRQNSRYWPALYLAGDARAFAQAIADAGYATDPAYGAKLIRLMDQYDLYQYDLL
jgi:LysM repeat protein